MLDMEVEMAHPKEINFSIHEYDKDGEGMDSGVFLHFGTARVKAAETLKDFREIVRHFEDMVEEIERNYPDA